ncbi:hypothetical protein RIF29_27770 [Crotalaria pallida]|uniref:CRAL-TRIO domain-containing protein n=1 Tax=Crotalaria pallida TaxID=3830 RepID=A0AAN9I0R7_CROPI
MAEKKAYRKPLITSCSNRLGRRIQGGSGSSSLGHIAIFLLKVAALEMVRRFSKSRCPHIWRGLRALQILCYPPFKWIQRWAPFKGLVKSMQVLSRPLLVLSIATTFSDQLEYGNGTSDSSTDSHDSLPSLELSPVQDDFLTSFFHAFCSQCLADAKILESENWSTKLNHELENQGISLPERINDDELHKFYAASNNDFSCFLASIKKTIQWRKTYRILSEEELLMWSKMVFWHGSDVMNRPCLIVRLGLACNTLTSQDRPRFSQAVVSQVEYGVLYLVDADNPEITVVVDCEGLSPLRIPMQMMRSCSSLLQDHFPNRLGSLFVVRLPEDVDAQTFIEVLKPATRNKLKIEGRMYQKVLSDNLFTLPLYLGGSCTCMKCSELSNWDMLQHHAATGTSIKDEDSDISDDEDSPSLHASNGSEFTSLFGDYEHMLRTVIIGFLIFWAVIALCASIYDSGGLYPPE